MWQVLSESSDRHAVRELSVHLEHREKNYLKALDVVHKGLQDINLSESQKADFEKRYQRLTKKIKRLEREENLDNKE